MADFGHEITNWATGVISSLEGDKIADDALMVAKNTQFVKWAEGQAALGTRPGFRTATTFLGGGLTRDPAYMVNYPYAPSNSVAYTNYLAVIDSAGKLRYKEPDDSWDGAVLTPPAGYPSPATCIPPEATENIDSTVMNGRLFLIGGTVRRSLLGKTYKPFGLDAPEASVAVLTRQVQSLLGFPAGVAVMPADVYDVFGTAYDSTTGAESPPRYFGAYTVNAGDIIRVQFTNTFLSDKCRIYLRRQSTQAVPYLVVNPKDINNALATSDGNIPATVALGYINSTGDEIQDYIIPIPTVAENNALSPEALYLSTYGRRLVAASRRKLFYSKLDQPESFPPQNFEIVDVGNGEEIVGLLPVEDELLLIFTTRSVFGLFGIDPQYWVLKPISTAIGCVGRKSIVKFDGGVAWWSPQFGPVMMEGQTITTIGTDRLGREVLDTIQPALSGKICAGWDPYHQLLLFSVPCRGSLQNNCVLPYHTALKAWCASEWDGFGIPCMATGFNNSKAQRLFVADNWYRIYYLDSSTFYDGITPAQGTVFGTIDPLDVGANKVVLTHGSGFYTQAFGGDTADMTGQMITFVRYTGEVVGRRTITANTATGIGWGTSGIDDITLESSMTYYISQPHVQIKTKQFDGGQAFLRKRFDRLYTHVYQHDTTTPVRFYYELNQQDKNKTLFASIYANAAETATLDATWDVPVTVNVAYVKKRLAVFKNSHMLRLVVEHPGPGPIVLSRIMLTGRMLSDRYYA